MQVPRRAGVGALVVAVHWEHVATVTADGVVLADGYRRWSPAFPEGAHRRS